MKKLLTVTCLAGLLSIPSVVFADEVVPEEAMSDEAMAEEAMPAEPEVSPEMQGHLGDSHSGAVWYGSIRVGVRSSTDKTLPTATTAGVRHEKSTSGVHSVGSRWGIRGSSEVSEGLTAVYNFEESLDATNATVGAGDRLSYVGLSGGFGSITLGRISSATTNSFGAITDNSGLLGASDTTGRTGPVVSYAVSVGSVDLQADVVMNKIGGLSNSVENTTDKNPLSTTILRQVADEGEPPVVFTEVENGLLDMTTTYKDKDGKTKFIEGFNNSNDIKDVNDYLQAAAAKAEYPDVTAASITKLGTGDKEDKVADAYEFGVTVNDIMETGKIAFAHKRHDMNKYQKQSSNYLAGQYGIGGLTFYLGAAQHKSENDTGCHVMKVAAGEPVTLLEKYVIYDGDDEKEFIYATDNTEKTTDGNDLEVEVEVVTLERSAKCTAEKKTKSTTFAGIRGSVGDTGVSFIFQARSVKTKGSGVNFNHTPNADNEPFIVTHSLINSYDDNAPTTKSGVTPTATAAQDQYSDHPAGESLASTNPKTSPWMIGLYKSLGGGASINFEYADPDGGDDGTDTKGKSVLWLQVDF